MRRNEPRDRIDAFEQHRLQCGECWLATSHRNACRVGAKLHEMMVIRAHGEAREPEGWDEPIDLSNFNERDFTELVGQMSQRQSLAGFIEGVDTSIWQGDFPWNEAVAQGLGFGIAKASEGNGYTDPRWGTSCSRLLSLPQLVGGSYHFGRPDLNNTGQAEAMWYLSRHPAPCFSPSVPWIFALDAESASGSASWCYGFLDTVSSRIGYSCWFYSFANWISSRAVHATNRPLWIAWPNPGAPPNEGWPVVTAWQWGTRTFSVGQVDADRFLGDPTALLTLAGVTSAPPASPPVPPPPPPIPTTPGGGRMLAFRPNGPNDRWDFVSIRGGRMWHRWGDSISGIAKGVNVDGTPTLGQDAGAPDGVGLVPGTEWVTWDASGNWSTAGAQGPDGRQWYVIGNIDAFVVPGTGWAVVPGGADDLPQPGPAGPTGASGPPFDDAPLLARVAQIEGELAAIKAAIR